MGVQTHGNRDQASERGDEALSRLEESNPPDIRITREWLRCWLLMAESVSLAAALAGPVSDWLGAARRGHAGDTEPEGNHHET